MNHAERRILRRMIAEEQLEAMDAETHRVRVQHCNRRNVLQEFAARSGKANAKTHEKNARKKQRKQTSSS